MFCFLTASNRFLSASIKRGEGVHVVTEKKLFKNWLMADSVQNHSNPTAAKEIFIYGFIIHIDIGVYGREESFNFIKLMSIKKQSAF